MVNHNRTGGEVAVGFVEGCVVRVQQLAGIILGKAVARQ